MGDDQLRQIETADSTFVEVNAAPPDVGHLAPEGNAKIEGTFKFVCAIFIVIEVVRFIISIIWAILGLGPLVNLLNFFGIGALRLFILWNKCEALILFMMLNLIAPLIILMTLRQYYMGRYVSDYFDTRRSPDQSEKEPTVRERHVLELLGALLMLEYASEIAYCLLGIATVVWYLRYRFKKTFNA